MQAEVKNLRWRLTNREYLYLNLYIPRCGIIATTIPIFSRLRNSTELFPTLCNASGCRKFKMAAILCNASGSRKFKMAAHKQEILISSWYTSAYFQHWINVFRELLTWKQIFLALGLMMEFIFNVIISRIFVQRWFWLMKYSKMIIGVYIYT